MLHSHRSSSQEKIAGRANRRCSGHMICLATLTTKREQVSWSRQRRRRRRRSSQCLVHISPVPCPHIRAKASANPHRWQPAKPKRRASREQRARGVGWVAAPGPGNLVHVALPGTGCPAGPCSPPPPPPPQRAARAGERNVSKHLTTSSARLPSSIQTPNPPGAGGGARGSVADRL